jgi:hypothetical protein
VRKRTMPCMRSEYLDSRAHRRCPGSRGAVAERNLFAEGAIQHVRFDAAGVYAELLFLGRGLRQGLRHLVQFSANALIAIAEKAVLTAEVAADDAAGIDENHVRHHQ